MSKLHICYAIDDNYVQMCLMSIYDIILHKNKDTELDFMILGDNLTKIQNFNKFNSIDKVHIKIKQINSKAFINEKDNKPNQYITGANRMRVIIPRLPEYKNVDKVLYLDADTLVTKDLTEVFNIDLEDKPIGICKNSARIIQGFKVMQIFDYKDRCHILNSGVILFNNRICRNIDFTRQCIEKMRENGNSNQHVISQLFYNDVKLLPPTINFTPTIIVEPFLHTKNIDIWNLYYRTQYKSIKNIFEQSYILHFIGNLNEVLANEKNRQIYNNTLKRLNNFLNTGQIDRSFIPDSNYYIQHYDITF